MITLFRANKPAKSIYARINFNRFETSQRCLAWAADYNSLIETPSNFQKIFLGTRGREISTMWEFQKGRGMRLRDFIRENLSVDEKNQITKMLK